MTTRTKTYTMEGSGSRTFLAGLTALREAVQDLGLNETKEQEHLYKILQEQVVDLENEGGDAWEMALIGLTSLGDSYERILSEDERFQITLDPETNALTLTWEVAQ